MLVNIINIVRTRVIHCGRDATQDCKTPLKTSIKSTGYSGRTGKNPDPKDLSTSYPQLIHRADQSYPQLIHKLSTEQNRCSRATVLNNQVDIVDYTSVESYSILDLTVYSISHTL